MPENILTEISGDLADPAELEVALLSHYRQSEQPANDLVLYGDPANPALEAHYSAGGHLNSLLPGPGFHAEDIASLRSVVRDQLLAPGPIKIGRKVMFSAVPAVGFFRFRDSFQLIPVPPEAPRPKTWSGKEPFILEVSFQSCAHAQANLLRRTKREREIELLCSLLLAPGVRGQSNQVSFHWVYEPITDGNLVSTLRQGGYSWPGASFASDAFASTAELLPMPEVDPNIYYSKRGVSRADALSIPANFSESFERVGSLSELDQKRFIRACYWFQQSLNTWVISRSIAFESLVCAIEALLPPQDPGEPCDKCGHRRAPGPTRLFAEFVDRFAPDTSDEDRGRFYKLRSAISHGGKLLHSDEMTWGVGATQANQDSDMRSLSEIVRAASINWLYSL